MNEHTLYRMIRFIFVLAMIAASIILLYFLAKAAYPFFIAFGIAFLINPIVRFLEKTIKLPRILAVLTSLLLLIGVFIGLMTLLIVEIVAGTNYLANVVPEHVATLVHSLETIVAGKVIPLYNHLIGLISKLESGQQDAVLKQIQLAGEALSASIGNFVQHFLLKLPSVVSWIPNTATVLLFSLIATFLISKDWDDLTKKTSHFIPETIKHRWTALSRIVRQALFGYLFAQFTFMSITFLLVISGLLFLKVQYALTIALVCAFVDLLPYVGTGIIFIPWIMYGMATGDESLVVGLIVLYLIIVVQRQLTEPKILSSSIGLNPLATLIALFIGFQYFGFIGFILGPVLLVFLTALYKANVFRDIWSYIKGKTY